MKVNCDRVATDSGLTCGGAIPNSDSELVAGFDESLGTCTITSAPSKEVSTLSRGFRRVWIESDSSAAINLI